MKGLIESGAVFGDRADRVSAPSEHEIELSKAISLRRIADALDGLVSGDLGALHNAVTELAWQAGQNFGRGIELGRRQ